MAHSSRCSLWSRAGSESIPQRARPPGQSNTGSRRASWARHVYGFARPYVRVVFAIACRDLIFSHPQIIDGGDERQGAFHFDEDHVTDAVGGLGVQLVRGPVESHDLL